ncbi:hypothetical protein VMCG_07739 [Cytospora schulzeri]|uniref:Pyruvate carboxylase n=1 Tax=Cytospora schulzeri TaxID=448051 RepID=A0A423VZ20_9PEZI|nr:hypothetical protein VMCG_07739 [Valsa malicola]
MTPRILVANRGEIAVRILATARELGLHTIAVTTNEDDAHSAYAHEAVQLPSSSSYMDVDHLVSICQNHHVDLLHPGYGFLSESADFCEQLEAAGITFVGPGPDILRKTADKINARKLAYKCEVPILPALTEPVDDIDTLRAFAEDVGMPLMIKAVDGGGGRGIRLVQETKDLEDGFRRALNESQSKKVFAEKAAVGGYRHIEVQILGDGQGNVVHFWERECSIQRRYQKVVEVAPSTVSDRSLVASVIDAAVRMAKAIKYLSLGTWEFLLAPEDSKFYFLEINPRLQVEHTVTESLCGNDLVRYQVLLALGKSFKDIGLNTLQAKDTGQPPQCTAIQFRIIAEDPTHGFSPSIGKARQVLFPGGNGIRVDTHLRPGVAVSASFDPLLAKLTVTSLDWTSAVEKALRALQDVSINGVTTNLSLLRGIARTGDFRTCQFDTQWLEGNLETIMHDAESESIPKSHTLGFVDQAREAPTKSTKSSDHLLRKGDHFRVDIQGHESLKVFENIVSITSVMRNDFPESLAIKLSAPTATSPFETRDDFTLRLVKHSEAQASLSSSNQVSKPLVVREDPSLLISPLSGQLVEVLVDDEDIINEGDTVAIVRQMKMELDIRAHRSGTVKSVFDLEEGDAVSVGMVICRIIPADRGKL